MNLLLITETAIIEQIFSLICKKLNIELKIIKSTDVSEKYDLIIIDQNFIDDKFNIIKQFSKKLGAISSEELSFDKSRDFIIPRPFLPTKLQDILSEQIKYIQEDDKEQNTSPNMFNNKFNEDIYEEDEEVTIPVTNYVESLADNIYADIEDETDESIISQATIKTGGVLDSIELSKINDILHEEEIQNDMTVNKEDWQDISSIIDDALDEVRDYEFDLSTSPSKDNTSEVYDVILNNYNINELKPLLHKLNQELIDKLSNGEVIDLRLMIKGKN